MIPMGDLLYIVNPAALSGRAHRRWEALRRGVPDGETLFTNGPLHARELAAAADGFESVIAVGGDGTVNEVLSGIMDQAGPRPALGVIPLGSGNDVARCLGTVTLDRAAQALTGRARGTFDLLRVDYHVNGRPARRFAFLACNVGFSAAGLRRVTPRLKRWLGGKAAYFAGMAVAAVSYRPSRMTIRWDGGDHTGPTWLVMGANAEWMGGGGMRVAPGARVDDGEFNVTILEAQSRLTILRQMPKISSGAHLGAPGVHYFPSTRLEIDAEPVAGVDMDGEVIGETPVRIAILPQALTAIVLPFNTDDRERQHRSE